MDQDEAVPPLADDDQDEFEVTGAAATARWREVRFTFNTGFVVMGVGLLASWRLWHRSLDQLTWIGLSLGAVSLALFIWKHNLIGFSYSKSGGSDAEVTFRAKRPPVPREVAAPVLLIAAVVLFLAGTSTGVGRRLASVFGVFKTLYDAGETALGLITAPLAIIVMLIFAAVALGFIGTGIFYLLRFVVRGFRPHPEEGSGLGYLFGGIASLAALAFMVYSVVRYHDQMIDVAFEPFRTIWGWFQ